MEAWGEEQLIESVTAHVESAVGEIDTVFHEIVSDGMHIDVHHVPPDAGRPFQLLVTSGLALTPMSVPDEATELALAELCMLLPADWPCDESALADERNYWPFRLLKSLPRYVHEYGTWIGPFHTLQNFESQEPYAADVPFTGVLVLPSLTLGQPFMQSSTPGGLINFHCLYPLHPDELNLAQTRGTDALLDAFDSAGVSDIVSKSRPSSVRKRKLFGLF